MKQMNQCLIDVAANPQVLCISFLITAFFLFGYQKRNISAIAGILLKSELLNFFQFNFCRAYECLLENSDILFGSEW